MTHNRKNVLQVTTSLSAHDGLAETVRVLCGRLDRDRFRLGICSIADREDQILDVFREMPVDIYALGRKGFFFDPLTTLAIARVVSRFRADIVHTHNNKGNLHGRLAAFVNGRAAIVTTHHDLGDILYSRTPSVRRQPEREPIDVHNVHRPTFVETRIYPFFNVALNRLNAKVIAVSDAVRAIHTNDPADNHFETVYSPYDEEIFLPRFAGPAGSRIVIGTVGRLTRVKGHAMLLAAMQRINQTAKNVTLRIIGEGPFRSEIEANVRRAGLESVVELTGHRPHDERLYEGIDIYVQPSLSEGCSITLLEAMAMGIPVIASGIEGPKELILHDETGFLVPAKDPDALADAILGLIHDPERAQRMGLKGSERARESFSGKIFAERMTRLYDGILSDTQGPHP